MAKALIDKRVRRQRTPERIAEAIARRGLSVPQRLAIHALVQTTTAKEALALLVAHNVAVDKVTLWRWRKLPSFSAALKAAEEAVAESITKNSVMRKTEAALDKAMEGTPILGYVGKDEQEIVGYKADLPSAARLIEMQGKAVGLFQDDSATKIAVLVDVDFSGRKGDPVAEVSQPVMDAEVINDAIDAIEEDAGRVSRRPRPTGSGLASSDEDDSWLG